MVGLAIAELTWYLVSDYWNSEIIWNSVLANSFFINYLLYILLSLSVIKVKIRFELLAYE